MGERLAFTFALTGRREWGYGTQGVALGYGLAGLSARAGPQTGDAAKRRPPRRRKEKIPVGGINLVHT